MLLRRVLANARPVLRSLRGAGLRFPSGARRSQSSQGPSPNPLTADRASRILDRLPPRFQKHTVSLRQAPLSHIVAFLILHEITAIVPVLALFSLFHYTSYTPVEYVTGHWATYVRDGAAKAERYFSRKGWFGFEQEDRGRMTSALEASPHAGQTHEVEKRWAKDEGILTGSVAYTTTRATPEAAEETEDLLRRWVVEDARYKVVVEVAMAWAITKALLPARILLSLWGTPRFANVLVRARSAFRRS